jgi:hypothetical protein
MEHYLKDTLGVPKTNIQTLYDKDASRSGIIEGIRSLTNNPSIKRHSPILIFYAGHGNESPAPQGWESQRSKIQMIVPQDYHTGKEGKRVHGIPDRSIGVLLEKLAEAKGDNIVCSIMKAAGLH